MTLEGTNCVRADSVTLVFVDGEAELTDSGAERRLEVSWMTENDGAAVASVAVNGGPPITLLGHEVDPAEWAEAPPEGCDGPYFLATGFEVAQD